MNDKATLEKKIFIKGKIVCLTGLHIGGSKSSVAIGGIDLNVIKTGRKGQPFIPGSSLKGKLRSMLARAEGSMEVKEDSEKIKRLFGYSGDDDKQELPGRLIIRDAMLDEAAFKADFVDHNMELEYTDVKFENVINRKTGSAKDLRQLERVPAGTAFNFELVYNKYDIDNELDDLTTIRQAMYLLQDDYIGGSGSRGYGKIVFSNVNITERTVASYAVFDEKPVAVSNFKF